MPNFKFTFTIWIVYLFLCFSVRALSAIENINFETITDRGTAKRDDDGVGRQKRSDDVDLASLQTVVQTQARTIQQMQSELTALKNSLPSTFAPVTFSVRFSKDNVQAGLDMSTHSILQFDQIVTNVGNGYSPQTGIFTAPYAGVYSFFLKLMAVNHHGHIYVDIVKEGSALDYAFGDGTDTIFDQGFTLVTAHLAVGEKVWARQRRGDAIRGGWFTIFTGCLEQAD